jgi:hypothetical protein
MSKMVEIKFSREMADAAIEGRKIATTRREKKGEIGDTFHIFDDGGFQTTFRIIEIMEVDLETVKYLYFRLEGFDSPEAFEKTWRKLHRGHYSTRDLYCIHFIARCEDL